MRTKMKLQAAEIDELFLLSDEEAMRACPYVKMALRACAVWWLRTTDPLWKTDVCCIDTEGVEIELAYYNVRNRLAVRPAFRLPKQYSILDCGDMISMGGYAWTIIPGGLALCNKEIGLHCFHDDWRTKDANDYEKSDIKGYLVAQLQKWKRKEAEKEEQAA